MVARNIQRLVRQAGPCFFCFVFGFVSRWSIYAGPTEIKMENELPLFLDPPVKLLVLVTSSPSNSGLRGTIRQTWLSEAKNNKNVKYFFVIGDRNLNSKQTYDLAEEKSQNNDLMVLPVFDSYATLTNKILKSYEYSLKNYRFDYLLKCDDDTFVDLKRMLEELEASSEPHLYWGFFDGRAPVQTKGKWADPNYRLCDLYVPYALGGGYVLGRAVVDFLASNTHILQLYNSEDVSVGTWLAGTIVRRKHDPRFDTEWKSRGCSNKFLVTHKQTQADMKVKWKRLSTSGSLCNTEETKVRLSYVYDWSKPPSECCVRSDHSVP